MMKYQLLLVVALSFCIYTSCENTEQEKKKKVEQNDQYNEVEMVDVNLKQEEDYILVLPDKEPASNKQKSPKTPATSDHSRPKAPKTRADGLPPQVVKPTAETPPYIDVVKKAQRYKSSTKPRETTSEAIAAAKLYDIPLDVLEVNLAYSRRQKMYASLVGFKDPVDYKKDVEQISEAYVERKADGSVVTVLLSKPTDAGMITVKVYTQTLSEDGVSTSYVKYSEMHSELAVDMTKEPTAKDEMIGEYSLEPALKVKKMISLNEEEQLLENLYLTALDLLTSPKAVNQFKGYEKMMSAADKGHSEAGVVIASQRLFGSQFLRENSEEGINNLKILADKGVPSAQRNLGFVYSSGLLLNSSQSKALMYYTFSALGDDSQSHMALGYRYWAGIGVEPNCDTALEHYRTAAMKVALESESSHKSNTPLTRVRLLDEDVNGATANGMLDDDLIQYYQFLADKGDINAMVGLGQLYLQGARGVAIDFKLAHHYFTNAANLGNSNANAYLGKLFLEGNSIFPANNQTAFNYYTLAEQKDSAIGQHGLGLMYLRGSGVTKDLNKAFLYFSKSAGQGHSDAQYKLATMYYHGITGGRTDYKLSVKWFKMAAQSGHLLAMYELGKMHAGGIGVLRSCYTATELFKNVAERGSWAEQFSLAHKLYRNLNHKKQAFYLYSTLAEMGYEVAQSNVAYILDKGGDFLETLNERNRYERAFSQLTRAASQGNTMARLRIGDYHYFGLGTSVDFMAAASQYRLASDVPLKNAQAMFNLAYMFEMGLGTKQDIHLAKRFYDMSIDASEDAYVPVTMALFKLSAKFLIESFAKGTLLDFVKPKGFSLHNIYKVFGANWDIYIGTVLAILLGILMIVRQQRQMQT